MATVDFEAVEKQALGLGKDDRARLAHELLDSIGDLKVAEVEPLGWMKPSAGRRASIVAMPNWWMPMSWRGRRGPWCVEISVPPGGRARASRARGRT
ncbi:MAG: hypothetical protein U1F30_08905 [Steroidobacteraceae bacterium]